MRLFAVINSPDKKKRYMAVFLKDDNTIKTVKFGDPKMESYIMHGDKQRRENYRSRHARDLKTGDPTRPGFLSYFLLWNKPTLGESIMDYKQMFGL